MEDGDVLNLKVVDEEMEEGVFKVERVVETRKKKVAFCNLFAACSL